MDLKKTVMSLADAYGVSGDENSAKIQALIKALETDDIKNFIAEKYNGAVVAMF